MEVYEFRSDRVEFPPLGNDPGGSTLNILKSGFKRLVNSNQKAVAIVEPRSHKSVDSQLFWWPDVSHKVMTKIN